MKKLLKRSAVLVMALSISLVLCACGDDKDELDSYTVVDKNTGETVNVMSNVSEKDIDKSDDTKESKKYRKEVLNAFNEANVTLAMWNDITGQSADIVKEEESVKAYQAQLREKTEQVIAKYEALANLEAPEKWASEQAVIAAGCANTIKYVELVEEAFDQRFDVMFKVLTAEESEAFKEKQAQLEDDLYTAIGDTAIEDMRGTIERVIRNMEQ